VKKLRLNMGLGRAYRQAMIVWLLFTLVVIFIIAGTMMYMVKQKYQQLMQLSMEIQTLTDEVEPFDHLVQVKRQTQENTAVLNKKLKKVNELTQLKKKAPVHILNELVELIPEQLFIESLILNRKEIELKGYAFSLKEVMYFLNRLEESKQFKKPSLKEVGTINDVPDREGLTAFTISAYRI